MFTTKKPEPSPAPSPSKTPDRPAPAPRASAGNISNNNTQKPVPVVSSQEVTVISQGCFIKGEILGADDISVLGKIDGTISLKDNTLTIERSGNVEANIDAKVVNVTGTIIGNIEAHEKITLYDEGSVTGDMTAPKVILKDGSYFKGNISMTDPSSKTSSIKQNTGTQKNKSS